MERDAFIKNDQDWFRVRACGIIIDNNEVLMVKNNVDDYYYSVGGAIHIGETLEDACIREVYEETGTQYEIDKLAFVHENFFYHNNMPAHEISFYFLMKNNGTRIFNSVSHGMDGAQEKMVWISLDEYSKYKAYPEFFKDNLKNISNNVKHFITRRK
ncbi:NUDIX hydrolase [Haploplasma axanthum]|uniref:Dihydroneopterin triphosphate pyrophosphatase n=1 Tax=Haploplasma axanthum TaxID=29552 RepID=A0A449BDE2_HAPAX|nr:NUDIX domain-containing protein [Haploplasma axanthum]VEU80448.1 dihydroneopterin triphosphate pyrophosphatase [Haploplasma axanthum]